VTGDPGKTLVEFSISDLEVLHSCKAMKLFCMVQLKEDYCAFISKLTVNKKFLRKEASITGGEKGIC